VLVYTRAGEVLLLRRCEPADFWQSVTGSLREGESAAEAAVRELAEETGLVAAGLRDTGETRTFPIVPPWSARYAPGVTVNTEHLFLLELAERQPITLSPHEHGEFRWLGAEEAAAKASSWTNREAILAHVPGDGRR